MINVDCYICGSTERNKILTQEGKDPYLSLISESLHEVERSWYKCKDCQFIYRNPMPTESELDTLYNRYEEDVFKGQDPGSYFDKIVNFPDDKSENFKKAQWLYDVIEKKEEGLKILDVGCGGGTLFHSLDRFFEKPKFYGVELNPQYAKLAEEKTSAIIKNEFYKPGIFKEKFDVIVFTKVLEHILDPIEFLKGFPKDLAEGGLLFLEVPDVIDFDNLGADHPRFYVPHLYYYSPEIMKKMLEDIGFKLMDIRTVNPSADRSYLQVLAKY